MWTRMHKKKPRKPIPHFPETDDPELMKLPPGITQLVVDAVKHYNDIVSKTRYLEGKDINELLIKEAEEQDTKVFLDGIFDIVQTHE